LNIKYHGVVKKKCAKVFGDSYREKKVLRSFVLSLISLSQVFVIVFNRLPFWFFLLAPLSDRNLKKNHGLKFFGFFGSIVGFLGIWVPEVGGWSGLEPLSSMGGGWMSKLEKYPGEMGIEKISLGAFDPQIQRSLRPGLVSNWKWKFR
jgi:hypothetical protein